MTVGTSTAVADEKVADNALVLLVHKEGVAEDAAALDGGITGKDFRVHVAQDHLGRGGVVLGDGPLAHCDLLFQQRPKVSGSEMSQIEDFHKKEGPRSRVIGLRKNPSANSITSLEPETGHLT